MELVIIPGEGRIIKDRESVETDLSGVKFSAVEKRKKDKLKSKTEYKTRTDESGGEQKIPRKVKWIEKQDKQKTHKLADIRMIRHVNGKAQIWLHNGVSFFADGLDMQPFIKAHEAEMSRIEAERQARQEQLEKAAPSTDAEEIAAMSGGELAAILIEKGVIKESDILGEKLKKAKKNG